MPKKLKSCERKVHAKIKSGVIKKTFKCDSKGKPNKKGKHKCSSNEYSICKSSMTGKKFNEKHWGKSRWE